MDKSRDQRYVSNELCHFTGKGKTETEQYNTLLKILKEGWLLCDPRSSPGTPRTVSLDLSKPISTDEAINAKVVCFCDIPLQDLGIHVEKYSKFGLSFKKAFLIEKGACPVFYISNESPVPATALFRAGDFADRVDAARAKGFSDRALYFDTSVRAVSDILAALDMLSFDQGKKYFNGLSEPDSRNRISVLIGLTESQISAMERALKASPQAGTTIRMLTDFMLNYVFTYFKCFDAKSDVADELNRYMEREWRIGNDVQFTLDDVSRVFLPPKFKSQFRADFPAYSGQITFLE